MDPVTLTVLFFLPFLAGRASDPSPGFFHSKAEARTVECVRMSQVEMHDREPARSAVRGAHAEHRHGDSVPLARVARTVGVP